MTPIPPSSVSPTSSLAQSPHAATACCQRSHTVPDVRRPALVGRHRLNLRDTSAPRTGRSGQARERAVVPYRLGGGGSRRRQRGAAYAFFFLMARWTPEIYPLPRHVPLRT